MKFPTVDVRYNNLRVEAECRVVRGKPLPTIWNSLQSLIFVSVLLLLQIDLEIYQDFCIHVIMCLMLDVEICSEWLPEAIFTSQ